MTANDHEIQKPEKTLPEQTIPDKPITKLLKRAAIYARVSTKDQSPQMQLDALREFAARRGIEVVEEFVDHGVSGTRESRPRLNALMDAVKKRAVDRVLVYKLDRFARSVRHLVNALAEFEALGVEFTSYTENLDTTTPLGRAMIGMIAVLAQLERDLIVERSMEGQRRARARGKWIGRPRTEVDEQRVLELRRQGRSLREISKELKVSKSLVARVLRSRPETPCLRTTETPPTTPS